MAMSSNAASINDQAMWHRSLTICSIAKQERLVWCCDSMNTIAQMPNLSRGRTPERQSKLWGAQPIKRKHFRFSRSLAVFD
jgi:hypothetical protein